MAAWFDVKERLAALEQSGLRVTSSYRVAVPRWFAPCWGPHDVFVMNIRGIPTDDALCIMRLATLERLLAAAGTPTQQPIIEGNTECATHRKRSGGIEHE